MKKLNQILISASLLAMTSSAHSGIINFQGLADGSIGESAWTTFNVGTDSFYSANIDITSTPQDANTVGPDSYVYFDAGTAGLGVCSSGYLSGQTSSNGGAVMTVDNAYVANKNNVCVTGSDDNVDIAGESLIFTFNELTDLNSIWVNNNHDGFAFDGSVTFQKNALTEIVVDLTGITADNFALGYEVTLASLGFNEVFAADDTFTVSYSSRGAEQFYVSAIDVPEPAIVALLGLGLVGIGFARRKVK